MIDKKDTYKTVFWNKSPTIQEKTKNFTPVKTKPKGFTNSVEKFGGIIKELTESRKEMQKKTETMNSTILNIIFCLIFMLSILTC